MRSFLYLVLIFLMFFNCSKDVDVQTAEMPPPLADVLTFELSFGDESTIDNEDFLLARPSENILVNIDEDIFVIDEYKLKRFTKEGRPLALIGGLGEGPQEFSTSPRESEIVPSGYITVNENINRRIFSIVSPENRIVSKIRLDYDNIFNKFIQDNAIELGFVNKIFALNENEWIIEFSSLTANTWKDKFYHYLVYRNERSVKLIAMYEMINIFGIYSKSGSGTRRFYELGTLHIEVLQENKILYTHTTHDVIPGERENRLALHILSLENGGETTKHYSYIPKKIPKIAIDEFDFGLYMVDADESDVANRAKNRIKDAKYLPAFQNIKADGDYLFFLNQPGGRYGEDLFIASVFHIGSEQLISTIKLPDIFSRYSFNPFAIKNGYLYKLKASADIFPVIEKYKIDTAVYGK